jgi:hypothetical protein
MQALLRQLQCSGGLGGTITRMTHGSMAADVSATLQQTQSSGSIAFVVQLLRGLRTANSSSPANVAAPSLRALSDVAGWRHQRHIINGSCTGSATVSGTGSECGVNLGRIAADTASCRGLSTSAARRHSAADGDAPPAEQPANLNPLQASNALGVSTSFAFRVFIILQSCATPSTLSAPCRCALPCDAGSAGGH